MNYKYQYQPIFFPKFHFQNDIPSERVNDIISLLPSSYSNYKRILEIELPSNTITLKNNHLLFRFKLDTIVSIFGIITDIIVFENLKNAIIQVTSLKDGNTITINIFDNINLFYNLRINMLVIFFHYYIKVTDSYDITLQNGTNSYNKLIGTLSLFEFDDLYLELLETFPFNSLISLIAKPILTRTISNLITIKQIVYITIEHKYKHNKIAKYQHLKLKGKILIDDGTSEASGYIYDKDILNLKYNKK